MTLTEPSRTVGLTGSSTGTRTRSDDTSVASGRGVSAALTAARAGQAIRRAAVAAGSWVARTVRPPGAVVLAAATVGLAVGIALGWVELMVAGAASLLLLVASVPFLFGARSYDADLTVARERLVAGDDLRGEVVVRNHGRRLALPGRLDIPVGDGLVEFGVPLLRPGHTVAQPLEIAGLRRGVITVGPASTVRSDPIGLLRREHAFDDVHELCVHPRTVVLPPTSAGLVRDLEGAPTRRLVDADISFHAIREYQPGDARRQIHWKSTAKTGRLMVRQYEESRRSRMAVVLGVAEHEFLDADEFELAVSCAASLGVRALRDGQEIAVATGSAIPRVVRGRLRSIHRLPAASPRVLLDAFSAVDRLESTTALAQVARLVAESTEALSLAVLVAGSTVGLTRLREAALAFPADTQVIAVVCDERAHPRMRTLPGLTVLTVGTLDDLSGLLMRGAAS